MSRKSISYTPRRARWMALFLILLVFGVATALVLAAIEFFGYEAVRHGWDQAQPFVTAVKWGGMAILIWRWNDVIRWAANRWHIDIAWCCLLYTSPSPRDTW